MPLSRLELVSSHGDQTLSRTRFVLQGTSNATDSVYIKQAGLKFTPGRPILTTSIVHAHDLAMFKAKQAQTSGIDQEPGTVFLYAIPPNYHLGYGVFTSAYIDRQLKRVSGAPLRYAGGRKQLAFYTTPDTEAARMHIEAEVANGYPLEQHPQYELEPKYVLGTFVTGEGFDALVARLTVSAGSFEPVDFESLERSFRDIVRVSSPETAVALPTAIRDLLVGTVESMLISRMRMMRWQGLQLLGYRFIEGKDEVQIQPAKDMVEHRHRLGELGRLLASSELFTAELAWLKVFVARELELMRVELEGAELESLSD